MRYLVLIASLIAIGGWMERGYFDWLGLGTLMVLAVPVAITLRREL